MIRVVQMPDTATDASGLDTSEVVRDAIESNVSRLRIGLTRSIDVITAFETKYHFPSAVLERENTVEDLGSHEDYLEWIGEIHVRKQILAELDTLEHVVYEPAHIVESCALMEATHG